TEPPECVRQRHGLRGDVDDLPARKAMVFGVPHEKRKAEQRAAEENESTLPNIENFFKVLGIIWPERGDVEDSAADHADEQRPKTEIDKLFAGEALAFRLMF